MQIARLSLMVQPISALDAGRGRVCALPVDTTAKKTTKTV